jgi:hypothetical protein
VKGWTQVQYSWDNVHWYDWSGMTSPLLSMTSNGAPTGATHFSGTTKLVAWATSTYYVRAKDRFEWYDAFGRYIFGEWMLRNEYYSVVNSNYTEKGHSTAGCSIP